MLLVLGVSDADGETLPYHVAQSRAYNETPGAYRPSGYDLRHGDVVRAAAFQVVWDSDEGYIPRPFLVLPRSSTFSKYGLMLANGVGLVDCGYHGDIVRQWYKPYDRTTMPNPEPGDRTAQLVPFGDTTGQWSEVRVMSLQKWEGFIAQFPDRGGGLGSTGA